jgi:hypothetical protein
MGQAHKIDYGFSLSTNSHLHELFFSNSSRLSLEWVQSSRITANGATIERDNGDGSRASGRLIALLRGRPHDPQNNAAEVDSAVVEKI